MLMCIYYILFLLTLHFLMEVFEYVVDSNAGSVSQLVNTELALHIMASKTNEIQQYSSQPNLNQSHVYSNITPTQNLITKSQSCAQNINANLDRQLETHPKVCSNTEDLHLDSITIRDNHILPGVAEKHPSDLNLDNDLTLQDKENNLLSASRLRLLQNTTMIESALDLDSIDETSLGTSSQVGLMKIMV